MKKPVFVAFLLMILAMTLIPTSAQSATEPTFVAVVGNVESYGGNGWWGGRLGAFAEVGKWAEVGVYWTRDAPIPIANLSYIYSFCVAKLVNTTMVELNYTGKDFYVSGLWDACNVTFYYDEYGNITWTIEILVDDGLGELNIINNWTRFTVDIDGIQQIGGMVLYYWIRPMKPIPKGDVTCDGEIDIYDLVHVAKAYGNTPGIGNYYFDVDFNSDFIVDICDLTTLAANLGEEY